MKTKHRLGDGGSKDVWNVGKLLPDYTALQPRRQPSSHKSRRTYIVRGNSLGSVFVDGAGCGGSIPNQVIF
jgi:hypothetical protein